MSLGARATNKGGAKSGGHHHSKQNHSSGSGGGPATAGDRGKAAGDKAKPKEPKEKPQATSEQIRMANMIDRKEDSVDVQKMVKDLMEMTCRSEEEVCSALHDADNDMTLACEILFEESERIQGEWQTSEKKKKKPQPTVTGNGDADHNVTANNVRSRSRPRPRGSGRGRGRGGRGGGRGARRPPRADHHVWPEDGPTGTNDTFPATEDWDNEEWSGSLSDTKVFTASQPPVVEPLPIDNPQENSWSSDYVQDSIPSYSYHNSNLQQTQQQQPVVGVGANDSHSMAHQPMGMSGSLSAAQTQYLSQLTQQSHHSVYSSSYGVYGEPATQRKQRVRVPPPSKIPSSAVEMPDQDDVSGLLDVQFGALELETVETQHQQPVNNEPVAVNSSSHEAIVNTGMQHHDPTPTHYAPTPTSMQLNESVSASSTGVSSVGGGGSTAAAAVSSAPNSAPAQVSAQQQQQQQQHSAHVQQQVQHQPPQAASLESTLSTSMKALLVNSSYPVYTKPQSAAATYAPTVPAQLPTTPYTNVYQHQQTGVNSSSGSLAGAVSSAYPPSVTLSQYHTQPLNTYQQQTAASNYGYTAPHTYTAHHKLPKDTLQQYESGTTASNTNSLSSNNTANTQSAAAKVTTSTSKSTVSNTQYTVPAPAFYTQQQGQAAGVAAVAGVGPAPYAYDDHLMRGTVPHHMTGYYEVPFSRDATFGLSGERFGRADAASPHQVLPPGYAYFYQPPPTTYQYGVYPQYSSDKQYTESGADYGKYKRGAPPPQSDKHGAASKQQQQQPPPPPQAYPPAYTGSSLYVPHHHHHQMDARVTSNHRRESSASAGRGSAGSKPTSAKPAPYSQSYWTPN